MYIQFPTLSWMRRADQPDRRKSSCSLLKTLKIAAIGLLLLPTSIFAAQDLCRKEPTQYLCKGNIGIPREQMPQVEGDTRDHYLFQKSREGVKISLERLPAQSLIPVQSQISQEIVDSLVEANQRQVFKPCEREILVARNESHDHIIDGHHTATACKLLGGSQLAVIVQRAVNLVLNELSRFPGVSRLNLNDSTAP
jgi:hypothetical protein